MASPLHDVAASAESPLPDQVTGMLTVLATQRAPYALRPTEPKCGSYVAIRGTFWSVSGN